MHKKSQFIVFISLILFLSNMVSAGRLQLNEAVYAVDKGDNSIHVCSTSDLTCKKLDGTDHYNPNSLVSTNGDSVIYISSDNNEILRCYRRLNNELSGCKHFPDAIFNQPQGMATYPRFMPYMGMVLMANTLYVTNANSNVVAVCDITRREWEDFDNLGNISNCKEAVRLSHPATSIAISEDNKKAYLGIPSQHAIAICDINREHRTLGNCYYYQNQYIHTPVSVSISTYPNGIHHIYYLNHGINNRGATCLTPSGDNGLMCSTSSLVDEHSPQAISPTAMYVQERPVRDPHGAPYIIKAYIGAVNNPLLFCKINKFAVYKCEPAFRTRLGNVNSILYTTSLNVIAHSP